MAQKYVGVDLGSHHVKVAVISAGLRGVQVIDAFEEPVGETPPPGPGEARRDPLAKVLSVAVGLLQERGLLGASMGLCLPPGLLSYRVLGFPFSDERRIAQAVAFEAEGQFPVPIEQLAHGHLVVPSSDGGGRALLVAAKREQLEQITSVFKRAGADIKLVTSGAIAAAQVTRVEIPAAKADLAEQGLQPVALMVDIGHQFTHFVALGPKGPLAVRTLRRGGRHITEAVARGYKLDPDAAEASKHIDAFLPHRGFDHITPEQMESGKIVARSIEPILREIEHTRLWLRATYHLEVDKIVLAGGSSELTGIGPYLHEQTGLETLPLHVGAAGLRVEPGRSWSTAAAALGAAYGAARRPLVQLHDDASADVEGSWVQERMSSLVAIGVAVLAFGALDTVAQVKAAEAELAAYQDELGEASRRALGASLSPAEIDAKLAAVEGQDLTSLLPDRGALEVVAMITKAVTPSDLDQVPPPGVMVPGTPGLGAVPGMAEGDEEEGEEETEGAAEAPPPSIASSGPVPKAAGVVVADDLVIESLDIRERKIELKASALSSSAQDRLGFKLEQIGCITGVSRGKVRGDARKTFEMSMDNACYYKTGGEGEDPSGEESEE